MLAAELLEPPDTALRLSRLFGTSAEFWLNLRRSAWGAPRRPLQDQAPSLARRDFRDDMLALTGLDLRRCRRCGTLAVVRFPLVLRRRSPWPTSPTSSHPRRTLLDHNPYSPPSRSAVSSPAPCGTRPSSAVRVPPGVAAREGLRRHDRHGSSSRRLVGAPRRPSSRRPSVRSGSRRAGLQATFPIGLRPDLRARCAKRPVQRAFAARGWVTLGLSRASGYLFWAGRRAPTAAGILLRRHRVPFYPFQPGVEICLLNPIATIPTIIGGTG